MYQRGTAKWRNALRSSPTISSNTARPRKRPSARAMVTSRALVRREANVLSIIDGFTVAFWGAIVGLLLVSLMRAAPPGPLTPKPANKAPASRPGGALSNAG